MIAAILTTIITVAPGHIGFVSCGMTSKNFGVYDHGHVVRHARVQYGSGALVFRDGAVVFADRDGVELQNGSQHRLKLRVSCGES